MATKVSAFGQASDATPAFGHPVAGTVSGDKTVLAGGVPWEGQCQGTVVSTQLPCELTPVEGESYCRGHMRQVEKSRRAE